MEIIASLVSTIILLIYFYLIDRNREPWAVLVEAFTIGFIISLQIDWLQTHVLISNNLFFQAFIVAGLIEEGVKLTALRYTLFRNRYFTEKVDGITYAVFLSLGFATAENMIVTMTTEQGLIRAVTAVPAHALYAIPLGYYLGKYKFKNEIKYLFYALLVPVVLHGIYNYILMSGNPLLLLLFIPYVGFLWYLGVLKVNKLNKKVGE